MIIFDYDKYVKDVGRTFHWAETCKNHRIITKNGMGYVAGSEYQLFISDEDWESEVPDFMVGDRVVIKTWEQMETEYGLNFGGDIKTKPSFVTNMKHLCRKVATITNIRADYIELEFEEKNIEDINWIYTADMIELAYPTVRGCDKKKIKNPTYTTSEVQYLGQTAKCQYDDVFDLEKGIMLCMLKDKGITYSDIIKAVESAEKVVEHKFNVGDIVRFVNKDARYTTYTAWFEKQGKTELLERYNPHTSLKNGKELKVIDFGVYSSYWTTIMLYACEDLKGNIYLISEKGLEKVKD